MITLTVYLKGLSASIKDRKFASTHANLGEVFAKLDEIKRNWATTHEVIAYGWKPTDRE